MSYKHGWRDGDKNAKPYHPGMKSYTSGNIKAFVRQCADWDDIQDDCFTLKTGEIITVTDFYKYFEKPMHYVNLTQYWADGDIISQSITLKHNNSSFGSDYGDENKAKKEQDVLDRIHEFRRHRRRMSELVPILETLSSTGHQFAGHLSDPNPRFSVQVTDLVSFGDFKDAQNLKPQRISVGGTIIGSINTVRPFHPGKYVVSVITYLEKCDPLVIFHHEDVDPRKVAYRVFEMAEDYMEFHRDIRNSINRYDWCHWRNWGPSVSEEDEEAGDMVEREDEEISKEDTAVEMSEDMGYGISALFGNIADSEDAMDGIALLFEEIGKDCALNLKEDELDGIAILFDSRKLCRVAEMNADDQDGISRLFFDSVTNIVTVEANDDKLDGIAMLFDNRKHHRVVEIKGDELEGISRLFRSIADERVVKRNADEMVGIAQLFGDPSNDVANVDELDGIATLFDSGKRHRAINRKLRGMDGIVRLFCSIDDDHVGDELVGITELFNIIATEDAVNTNWDEMDGISRLFHNKTDEKAVKTEGKEMVNISRHFDSMATNVAVKTKWDEMDGIARLFHSKAVAAPYEMVDISRLFDSNSTESVMNEDREMNGHEMDGIAALFDSSVAKGDCEMEGNVALFGRLEDNGDPLDGISVLFGIGTEADTMGKISNSSASKVRRKRVPKVRLDKLRNTIYFAISDRAKVLGETVKSGNVERSEILRELYSVKGDAKETIALAVDCAGYNSGEWMYAKAFQDKCSQRYFALVVNFGLSLDLFGPVPKEAKHMFPSWHFSSIGKTKLLFSMSEFIKS